MTNLFISKINAGSASISALSADFQKYTINENIFHFTENAQFFLVLSPLVCCFLCTVAYTIWRVRTEIPVQVCVCVIKLN